jgi:ribonucleoside-triphosphate reductase (thioredoxin)
MYRNNPLLKSLKESNYTIEKAFEDPENTVVVEFPIDVGEVRTLKDVTMWEQLMLASFLQENWADNRKINII